MSHCIERRCTLFSPDEQVAGAQDSGDDLTQYKRSPNDLVPACMPCGGFVHESSEKTQDIYMHARKRAHLMYAKRETCQTQL